MCGMFHIIVREGEGEEEAGKVHFFDSPKSMSHTLPHNLEEGQPAASRPVALPCPRASSHTHMRNTLAKAPARAPPILA